MCDPSRDTIHSRMLMLAPTKSCGAIGIITRSPPKFTMNELARESVVETARAAAAKSDGPLSLGSHGGAL